MLAAVFVFLILLVCAWACAQFLPHPVGTLAAIVVGLLALYVIVEAVLGNYVVA